MNQKFTPQANALAAEFCRVVSTDLIEHPAPYRPDNDILMVRAFEQFTGRAPREDDEDRQLMAMALEVAVACGLDPAECYYHRG